MNFKAEVRFGLKNSTGDDLILPNDVLKKAAQEYQARINAQTHVVSGVTALEDKLIVQVTTLDNDAGRMMEQQMKAGSVTPEFDYVVKKTEIDETGFPIVRELELRGIVFKPR
jgi:hypothetical protein